MFSTPQYLLLHQVLGPDWLLFSVDYPFSPNEQGRTFLDTLEINPTDKENSPTPTPSNCCNWTSAADHHNILGLQTGTYDPARRCPL